MAKESKEKVGASETPDPDLKEKDEVKAWLATLTKTEKWMKSKRDSGNWQRYIDEYKGKWDMLQGSLTIPVIPINLVYAYVKTEIARLYFQDPWITVNPKRKEDIGAAQVAEQIINYTWGELNLKQQIKLALLETLLVGHSWIKVGYVAEFGTVESQPKEDEKRGPGRPKKKEMEVDTSEYIKSENVFAYYVPYKDVIFDPSATWPATHNARWMAHKITKPIRAIKESGIYKHTDSIKSSSSIDDPKEDYSNSDALTEGLGKDIKSATLWEIYDLDHMKVITVSPGCDYKLSEIEYPDHLKGGLPFVQFGFNPIPGEVYPMSDIAPQEPLILEITKLVAMELNHIKRHASRQIITAPDFFTPEEEAKYKDNNDGAVLKAQGDIEGRYFVTPYASMPSDMLPVYSQVLDLYRSISGQTPADQGGPAKTQTRTLGELRQSMTGGRARADEKVDVLEESIAEVARKLLSIMQKKFDLPKISKIVGPKVTQEKILKTLPDRASAQPNIPQGQPNAGQQNPVAEQSFQSDFGFSWNRQDILGDMDVDVLAGSTVPMDRESQLSILEKLIPMLPAAGITPGSPAAKAYAREVFRLVGIQSVEAIMDVADQTPPQPNPKLMEIQAKVKAKQQESAVKIQGLKQTEMLKLEAQKQKLGMENIKNQMQMKHAHQKNQMDIQKSITQQILQSVRKPQEANANANGL